MKFTFFPVVCVLLFAGAGCATIGAARAEQRRQAAAASADPGVIAAASVARKLPDFGSTPGVDALVAFALTNCPSVVSARLAVDSARLALVQTHAGRYPQLSGDVAYSRITRNTSRHGSASMDGSPSAGLSLDLLIYDFGRIRAEEREAREQLVAAEHDFLVACQQVVYDVRSAYYTLLMDDALLAVARTNEWQRGRHLELAERQFSAGVTRKLDVTQARMNLSNSRLATITASNDVVSASADLLRAIGVTVDHATRAEVLAAAPDPLNPAALERLQKTTFDPAAALVFARTNAPSLLVLRAKLRAASARVDYAVADLFPSLSIGSAFNFTDPSFPATWNWSWGVKLVQSFFQGFRKRTAVDAAVVSLRSSRAELAVAEQRLSLELARAVAARDTARQSLEATAVILRQARENLELATEQYRVGDISSIDLLDAEAACDTALGDHVRAVYNEEIAEARLAQLTGAEGTNK